jgi:hypothetical protein
MERIRPREGIRYSKKECNKGIERGEKMEKNRNRDGNDPLIRHGVMVLTYDKE